MDLKEDEVREIGGERKVMWFFKVGGVIGNEDEGVVGSSKMVWSVLVYKNVDM